MKGHLRTFRCFFVFGNNTFEFMRHFLILVSIFFSFQSAFAQDVGYAQKIIDTLSSPYFHGRGYVSDGDRKAALFIANELKSIGVESVQNHVFYLNVNTFPGEMGVETNCGVLRPGYDFLVDPASPKIKVKAKKIIRIGQVDFQDEEKYSLLLSKRFKSSVVIVDTVADLDELQKRRSDFIANFEGKCLIEVKKKLTWSVSRTQKTQPHIWTIPGVMDSICSIDIVIDAQLVEGYKTSNVVGTIKGTEHADSFIVLTGHYDHLGRMGKDTYMPGANDNASGIAMILDMARELKKNPPKYSVMLIGFAGEEAGLVGSYFFVQEIDKFLDINSIRFLINMDLMGSGELGVMAVNGKIFTEEFDLLNGINTENQYLLEVRSRGKAANSDHYFFTEAGVRGFFFYLMGEYAFYHEVDDSRNNLKLNSNSYDNSFLLIRDFMRVLMTE